jgi:hypothetical protein
MHLRAAVHDALAMDRLRATDHQLTVFRPHPYKRSSGLARGLRGRRPSPLPVRVFVLLPAVGFAVQEHLERLIGSGGIPHDLVLEPTFLVGLALQLPFALAALLVADALNALGFGIGRALARRLTFRRRVPGVPPSPLRLPASVALVTPSVLALGHGPRAPPASCGSWASTGVAA